jgi:kynurenine formamidase
MTHLDSLGHLFWNGQMYNGRPASAVGQMTGANEGSIEVAGGGVVTRGVLLDVPRALGVEWVAHDHRITPQDLEAAESLAGVAVRTGDAVLIRTGRDVARDARGPFLPMRDGAAGLSAACMPWLRERDVAVLGADAAHEAHPSPYSLLQFPVHVLGIVAMGLWLLDNAILEELACAAVEDGRWEFLLVLAPLKLQRGTGSVVNPIAMF